LSEELYAKIVETMLLVTGVTLGSGKRGFGSSALRINNKIFAMLSSKGEFVVKLPKQRVDALVTSGAGVRFDPGHGRIMKEWLAANRTSREGWQALAKEAMEYVAGKK
jgi:hypothetical protein